MSDAKPTLAHGGLPACLDPKVMAELKATAEALSTPGKGFLAADESAGPWMRAGHSEAKKVPDTKENRGAYRSTCFKSPGLSDHISGVILHTETLYQEDAEGVKMVDHIKKGGMIAGIKLDKGYNKNKGLAGTSIGPLGHQETFCRGIDDLQSRAADAYAQGARFAKWRNVLQIDPAKGLPSDLAIAEATTNLARYASICQSEGLVPIVEPEIVPNGSHDIYACAAATERVLAAQFKALADANVYLEGCLLKPNMVKNGLTGPKASPEEVAALTVQALMRTVPPAIPGIFFLSGEMPLDVDNEENASINLSTMNSMHKNLPWHLSFSYGKAMQKTAIVTWAMGVNAGADTAETNAATQKALVARAKANGEANKGVYVAGSCASVGVGGNIQQAAGPY